ncbi:MAG: MFS transporter [Clostridia bacterium]|nr:MFS transporter [Clostridia bacterium]
MEKSKKLGARLTFNLILFGLMGQIAWAVENQFFNTFLFNDVGGTPKDISHMVAWSAVAAVLTTLIMGTLSDKVNKRKLFICGGYIFWGFTVIAFAFITRENIASLLGIDDKERIRIMTVNAVIIMDCLMTFMGSTGNDAAFNAWVTDITCDENRATTESILSLVGVFAMVAVTVAFPMCAEGFGYPVCFEALGGLVILCGIIGLFTVKDSLSGEKKESNFFGDLIYGFRPSVVKDNKPLYLALASVGVYNIAVQCFFPYIFIYLQHHLGFDFNKIGEALTPATIGIAVVAVIVVVVGLILIGKLIDKFGKALFVFPTIIIFVAGLTFAFFAKSLGIFALAAIPVLVGYGLLMIILNAAVRDFTPEDKVGQFQGIRMIFQVLLPMVIGPAIGNFVIERFADGTYTNDYGEIVNVPVPAIFLASAIVSVVILIPVIALRKTWQAKAEELKQENK